MSCVLNYVVRWPHSDSWFYNLKILLLWQIGLEELSLRLMTWIHGCALCLLGSPFFLLNQLSTDCPGCRTALSRPLLPSPGMLLFHLFLSSQAGSPHSFFRGARSHLEPGNFCSALRVTIHKDLTALNYSTHKEHFFSNNYKMLQ